MDARGARTRGRAVRADVRRVHADARASSKRHAERGRPAGSGLSSSSSRSSRGWVAARPPSVARATGRPPRPWQLRAGLSHGRGCKRSCAAGRVFASKAAFSFRAVRTSCQYPERRTDTRTPESGGNFQVAVSSGDVLRTNPVSEKKRNPSEVTLSSNASP